MNYWKVEAVNCLSTGEALKKQEVLINLEAINYIIPGYKYGNETLYTIAFNHGTSVVVDKETYELIVNTVTNKQGE